MPHITSSGAQFSMHILQGLLTPIIGVTTVYIAWQQWKTNQRKYTLDRYERRLRVYQHVVEVLRLINRDFKPELPDLFKFSYDTAEATFLFGPEIQAYIDEIFSRAVALNTANFEYRDFMQPPLPGYDHQKVVNKIKEQEGWFVKQINVAKEKFRAYLDISR